VVRRSSKHLTGPEMPREQAVAALVDDLALLAVVAVAAAALLRMGVDWTLLLPVLAVLGFLALALVKGVAAQLRRPLTGLEALVGREAVVDEAIGDGREAVVRVEGEYWRARCRSPCRPGARVRVVGYEGLTLLVEPVEDNT